MGELWAPHGVHLLQQLLYMTGQQSIVCVLEQGERHEYMPCSVITVAGILMSTKPLHSMQLGKCIHINNKSEHAMATKTGWHEKQIPD